MDIKITFSDIEQRLRTESSFLIHTADNMTDHNLCQTKRDVLSIVHRLRCAVTGLNAQIQCREMVKEVLSHQ